MGAEAQQALQSFDQSIDHNGRRWIKTFNVVEAPRIDDCIVYSMWPDHLV